MKLYFLKQYFGTSAKYTHTALGRVLPLFDSPLNDKKTIMVQLTHPEHTGSIVRNLNQGMWDSLESKVDLRAYEELTEPMVLRINRSNLLTVEVDEDIDVLPDGEHYSGAIPFFNTGHYNQAKEQLTNINPITPAPTEHLLHLLDVVLIISIAIAVMLWLGGLMAVIKGSITFTHWLFTLIALTDLWAIFIGLVWAVQQKKGWQFNILLWFIITISQIPILIRIFTT